jgi:hypothetical protein
VSIIRFEGELAGRELRVQPVDLRTRRVLRHQHAAPGELLEDARHADAGSPRSAAEELGVARLLPQVELLVDPPVELADRAGERADVVVRERGC